MRIHYQGKFNGDMDSLPHGVHQKGAVMFREPDSIAELTGIALLYSLAASIPAFSAVIWLGGGLAGISILGILLSLALALPHEFLHAICFREDAYIYTNLKEGILFVVGPETMSKGRFILMSLLPSLVFGLLPLICFLINRDLRLLGSLGAMSLTMGGGDYMNVVNALRQMPRGARTYLYKFHSYWYMPD